MEREGVDELSCECLLEEPADYGEVAAFVVGGEDDRVLFFGRHGEIVDGRTAKGAWNW